MDFTQQQLTALKTEITNDPALLAFVNAGQYQPVVTALNADAPPVWYVWARNILTSKLGVAVSYVSLAVMTAGNQDRVKTFYTMNPLSFNARPDIRDFFTNTFSGTLGGEGQLTRDAVDALLYRKASRAEKICSTGIGSIASPATLGIEGSLNVGDIERILVNG